jgi:hypothetical protein
MPATPKGGAQTTLADCILAFEDRGVRGAEYARNLARGGAMIASRRHVRAARHRVVVVEVPFANAKLALKAEVVHSGGRLGRGAVPRSDARAARAARAAAREGGAAARVFERRPRVRRAPPRSEEESSRRARASKAATARRIEGLESTSQVEETDPNERTYRAARRSRAGAASPPRCAHRPGRSSRAHARRVDHRACCSRSKARSCRSPRGAGLARAPDHGETAHRAGKVVRHLEGDGVVGAVGGRDPGEGAEPEGPSASSPTSRKRTRSIAARAFAVPLEELGGASLCRCSRRSRRRAR